MRKRNIDLTAFANYGQDSELSFEDLDDVAGGKGFLQAAIASVIMFTGAAATIAGAAAPLTASAAYVTDWTENKDEMDDYFFEIEQSFKEDTFFDSVVTEVTASSPIAVPLRLGC